MEYYSRLEYNSKRYPGVRFTIARMSLGKRIELGRRIREIGLKGDFLAASDRIEERLEAGMIEQQINRVYMEWGLLAVDGIEIDGVAATPALLIERGPEALSQEILDAIRGELYLSEDERKN